MKAFKIMILVLAGTFASLAAHSQCGSAQGNETSFGSGSWIGYFYDGANNFTSANYQGYNTESEIFDQSFCGSNCSYAINGCSVNTETFTVRYKMRKNFSNGFYRITIGADDGVRLSVDNGSTYAINGWNLQSYTTFSTIVRLNGDTRMILEYYENTGDNRVSFNYTFLGSSFGGTVSASQNICGSVPIDPSPFANIESAMFISGTPNYQWQVSSDNSTWSNISGATSEAYDVPAGFTAGSTQYYRRAATRGGTTAYSNTLTVTAYSNSVAGDQITYGNGSWIGYVYDGRDNFSSNYLGEIFESEIFDESFGGSNITRGTTGCNFQTETFSVRFRMQKYFSCGDYQFTIGADDGVRLSIDGGSTWLVNDYSDHGYRTATSALTSITEGTYNLVLEYFENGGGNRVTFNYAMTSCILPVTWHSIEATASQGANTISWETASEKDNDGFVVERSIDGKTFENIGWVKGSGTTTDQHAYEYRDVNPEMGVNYYRLKQVDFDGKFDYSKIVSAENHFVKEKEMHLYPNPARDYVMVTNVTTELPSLRLTSILSGNVVFPAYESSTGFNLQDVPPGIYIALLVDGETSVQERLIVLEH
ncbi:MAG: T9SS type A sorting domain-containing protein [Cyclobacteriaceae bacterium]